MKKKFLIFALLAFSLTASFAFGACSEKSSGTENGSDSSFVESSVGSSAAESENSSMGSESESSATESESGSENSSDNAPETANTVITYVLQNSDGDTLTYTETVAVGTALSYVLDNIEYENTWYADSACTQPVSAAAGESMTVYATFNDIYIDYVLRSNNKTVAMDSIVLRDGEIVLPTPSGVEGHTFQGWAWGESTYQAGDVIVFSAIPENYFVEIEAVWTKNVYSVRYVSEGSETKEVTQTFGDNVQPAPERTGYTFLGWYEEGNDTPVTTISKEVELTAKWDPFTYAVAFDLGGYDGEHTLTNGDYDYDTQIALPVLDRTGYAFLGWYLSVDGEEGTKLDTNAYTVGSNLDAEIISFVAKFAEKERTVTVYLENGATDTVTLKTGENLSNALKGLIGERFSGWFYDAENLKGVGVNDVLPAIGDDVNFCVYGAYDKTYNITFVRDGVSESKTLLFGEDIEEMAEKTGHNFLGWYTQQEGGDKITQVPAGDQTLYAQFEKKTFNVTFNLDGGNGTVSDVEEQYNSEITLPTAEGLSKKYYNFGGWTDGTTTYAAGDSITIIDHIAFTAVWESYDVQLHLTDWDGTVIISGTYDSGSPLLLPGGSVWTKIDEFEGFYYEDIYGNEYYLREGDLLEKDVTAGAFYVNRRTGQKLVFPSVDTFEFYERSDSSYWISGRKRTFNEERGVYEYNQVPKAEGYPRDYFCLPATYQGKYIYGVPDGDRMSVGGFSIYAASQLGYDGEPYKITGHLYIPSCYHELGDYAFYSQQATIVEFGRDSELLRVGERADLLANITALYGFPQKLRQLGNYAMGSSSNSFKFYYQDGSEVTEFPTSLQYIGADAFKGVDLFTYVDLSNVISCGGSAFANCTKLQQVQFGGMTYIPSQMFYGCTNLKEVFVPACVQTIGSLAFQASGLETITFAENSQLKTIKMGAFLQTKLREIDIPDSVTTIENSAFAGMTSVDDTNESVLERVKLPASLETIGEFSFAGAHFSELTLPEGLKSVGLCAFFGTQNWKKVEIPNSLVTIGEKAFMKSTGYTYTEADKYVLKIGDSVEFIDKTAFRGIANICGIEFSDKGNLKEISDYAFSDIPSLEGATVNFPEGLHTLDSNIFVYMKEGGVYDIPTEESAKIKAVTLPSTLTWLGGYAFAYNPALESVTFADNQNAFGGEDEDGNGVVENLEKTNALIIGNGAFAYCTALTEMELPCHLYRAAGGTALSPSGIFWNCTGLKTVIFRGRESGVDDELQLSSVMFEGCTALKTIKIDRNSKASLFVAWHAYDQSVFMKDCTKVNLWVRSAYASYYNDSTNFWGECQPARIYRVRIL